jgi:valyl-tRNA synthetase
MMMFGIHFMKDVPFRTVAVHALVRDEQGQKMSKSKGNVIDPLAVLDRFGTDALRFTLVALSAMGRDVKLSEDRVEGYRNYANKIWNAARFVLMNVEGLRKDSRPLFVLPEVGDDLALADRWILHRLAVTTAEVRGAIEGYRFNEAAISLYRFLWNEYCDWYLEVAKIGLADPRRAPSTLAILVGALERFLRLLHPFMPFLTEELWQALPKSGETAESIMVAPYPEADAEWLAASGGAAEMERVIDVVRAIRNLRADLNVPPKARPTVEIFPQKEAAAVLAPSADVIRHLAGLGEVTFPAARSTNAVTAVAGDFEILLVVAGLIDPAAESERLDREIKKIEKEAERIRSKLDNPSFVERAPEDVVQGERAKQLELSEKRKKLDRSLAELRAL